MALESNTEIDKAADSTNKPLYVRKGANSWTRFSVALQLCFFMRALAIVLVGGAAKTAADGIFGVLTLLRLYTRPKGRTKKIFLFAGVPPSKLLGKTKRAGFCTPL